MVYLHPRCQQAMQNTIPKPQVITLVHVQVQSGTNVLRSERVLILTSKRAA